MIPQGVEQRGPWHEIERVTDAVDDKMDRDSFGNLMRDIAHVLLPATATMPDVSRVDAGARLRRPIAPNGPPTGWFLLSPLPAVRLSERLRSALCFAEHHIRHGAVDDLAQREARLYPRHARQARQLHAVDALEILDVAGEHDQNVVVGPRHQEAAHDGRAFHHLRLERLQRLIALAFQRDADQYRGGEAELREVERGLIALDVAVVLQRLLPPRERGA